MLSVSCIFNATVLKFSHKPLYITFVCDCPPFPSIDLKSNFDDNPLKSVV